MNVKQRSEQGTIGNQARSRELQEIFREKFPLLSRYLWGADFQEAEEHEDITGTVMLSADGCGLTVSLVPHRGTTAGFCHIDPAEAGLAGAIEQALVKGNFIWRTRRYIRPDCKLNPPAVR